MSMFPWASALGTARHFLRVGTVSSMLWSHWFTGPCITGGGGGVVTGGQWRSVVTVRKGECELVHYHLYIAHRLSQTGHWQPLSFHGRQHMFCVWLLTGAVHVSGWGSCWPSGHGEDRDHQGPGQSPGPALCGDQLRRRHGLQSKGLVSLLPPKY